MGLAAAVAGAAVIGAGASIYAADEASSAANRVADKNNALQTDIYNQNKTNLAPFVEAGKPATTAINSLLGLGGDAKASQAAYKTWQDATGYQEQLKQGQNSVTAALGAKGLTDSGAALKALTNYGQQAANNNFQTYLGNLQGQQNVGLGAASAQAGVSQNFANAVSQNNNNAANATGNAALTGANAFNSLLATGVSAAALGSSYGGGGSAKFDPSKLSNVSNWRMSNGVLTGV